MGGGTLLMAFALMLVIEGLFPLLAPRLWRDVFRRLVECRDGQIRFFGASSLLAGAGLLLLAR